VAGFVGIAFRQLSLFDSFLDPKRPPRGQSGLLVRQVLWSHSKSQDDTRSAERSVGGGFRVCGNPLSRAEGYHKTTPHRKSNENAAIQLSCVDAYFLRANPLQFRLHGTTLSAVFQCVHSGISFDGASISHLKELALVSGISTHANLRLAQPAVRDAKQ
jgi:hypothetical protein